MRSERRPLTSDGIDAGLIQVAIDDHRRDVLPRLERWWRYYRNPVEVGVDRAGPSLTQAQEEGLPDRLVRGSIGGTHGEIVIENDIGWRVHTMVDFMFGKPVPILSTAQNADLRGEIERALDRMWENSGGIALLQDAALLAHVYGHVDLVLRVDAGRMTRAGHSSQRALLAADAMRVEIVEPTRGVPVLSERDYRTLDAYIVQYTQELNATEQAGLLERLNPLRRGDGPRRLRREVVEVLTPWRRVVREDGKKTLDESLAWSGGQVPVAHIQNIAQPFRYEGLGEVEPLAPLQDELNTRLCDRASRVTMQSFRMYLAKGIEGFEKTPVGPGQVWSTENTQASVEAFGGDASCPSEERHIDELREAFDKVSGVPPLASGVVRAKIGNLSSANALRITLMGLLSKNARKRVTYGRGIARICELALGAMDHFGVLDIPPGERGVKLAWPDPLPTDLREQVLAAQAKSNLGVSSERVLAELGYAPNDPGVI